MNGFPPPTVPSLDPVAEPTFWQRRGTLTKIAIIGGGVLAGLTALGTVLPAAADDGDKLAVTDDIAAVEEPSTTETPDTTQAPIATDAPATPLPSAVIPSPIATDVPTPVASALTVARVIDGDTVEMSDGSTIRLIGIDTPEQGDCGYQEASDTLAMIVYGQTVRLTPGARDDVDRYDRLLRYLDLGNGVDANLSMIESAQAIARYDSRDGYGRHTREDAYVAADTVSAAFCSIPAQVAAPAPVVANPAPVVAAPAPVVAVPVPVAPIPVPAVTPTLVPVVPQPPTSVSYANCDAVRAAGAAPIYAGDPGFQTKFDRDGDGVGCE